MSEQSLIAKLDAAHERLKKLERQIKNLLIERNQNKMALDLLVSGGFLDAGKLGEALSIAGKFSGE